MENSVEIHSSHPLHESMRLRAWIGFFVFVVILSLMALQPRPPPLPSLPPLLSETTPMTTISVPITIPNQYTKSTSNPHTFPKQAALDPKFDPVDFQGWLDVPRGRSFHETLNKCGLLCMSLADHRLLELAPPIITLEEVKSMQDILIGFNIKSQRRIHFEGWSITNWFKEACPLCVGSNPKIVVEDGKEIHLHPPERDTADVNFQNRCFGLEMLKYIPMNVPPKNPLHHQACMCLESPNNWPEFFGNKGNIKVLFGNLLYSI